LIDNGARINSRDMGGRTALFLASKNNNLQSVKALLAGKANPGIKTYGGVSPMEVAENERVKGFLAKASLLHICMPLIPAKRRQNVWENEGLRYFKSADNYLISDFV
jgi:ankyrin repeat protein